MQVGSTVYTLTDESQVRVSQNGVRRLAPEPQVGDLLLYGTGGACGTFLARAYPVETPDFSGCLGIGESARDDGAFIVLRSGLRLPKAPGFVPPESYRSASALACLNEQGEVVYFR